MHRLSDHRARCRIGGLRWPVPFATALVAFTIATTSKLRSVLDLIRIHGRLTTENLIALASDVMAKAEATGSRAAVLTVRRAQIERFVTLTKP